RAHAAPVGHPEGFRGQRRVSNVHHGFGVRRHVNLVRVGWLGLGWAEATHDSAQQHAPISGACLFVSAHVLIQRERTPTIRVHPHLSQRVQTSRTFSPLGPFGPCPISNVTGCPSRRSSNAVCWQAELWKKYSVPLSARMKPKPLSLTSRLMVPF